MYSEWTQLTTVRNGKVEVSVPPFQDGSQVEVVVRGETIATTPKLTFGSWKGKIIMREDFDEPLEDFKEYM